MSPRLTVGVMGQSALPANETESEKLLDLARRLGRAIARAGASIITGATTGLPQAAAMAARTAGAISIGISPAISRKEHVERYGLPTDGFDSIIFTGFGLRGRNVVNVRSSDIVIVIGGGLGTLNEFTIACCEAKLIGVVDDEPGLSVPIRSLVNSALQIRSQVIFSKEPELLLDLCLSAFTGSN